MNDSKDGKQVDVLVLGAGMSGLAAARALAERGLRVAVLEARNRVGGRVFSEATAEGMFVEHGAEFVHGRAPALWALLDECGANPIERDGTMLREEPESGLAEDVGEDDPFSALRELEDFSGEDRSFADWLRESDVPGEERATLSGYVEGFNAADATRIGIRALGVQQKAEDAIEGDRAWHVSGGYGTLAEYLADRVQDLGGAVHLNQRVRRVHWTRNSVEVETSQGLFRAPKCVITLPLGVLQASSDEAKIVFTPEPAALNHARRLAMGHVVRFTLVFRERWWERSTALTPDALRKMSFLFTPGRMVPVWWTRHPESEPFATLVGWVGGTRSATLEAKTAEELGSVACADLAKVFAMDEEIVRGSLLGAHTHDWKQDPFSCGAYSYVPVGAIDAPAGMCVPEDDTLFFAGEHTDTTGHWGTVHAAIGSGLRAAGQILGEL